MPVPPIPARYIFVISLSKITGSGSLPFSGNLIFFLASPTLGTTATKLGQKPSRQE